MKKIMPNFKDDKDKIIAVGMIVLSMFLIFVPSLIVVLFLKDQVSEETYQISKMFLNFELLLFLLSLVFMIPVIGWLLGLIIAPIMTIANIILCIINLCAIAKVQEVRLPVPYEFI